MSRGLYPNDVMLLVCQGKLLQSDGQPRQEKFCQFLQSVLIWCSPQARTLQQSAELPPRLMKLCNTLVIHMFHIIYKFRVCETFVSRCCITIKNENIHMNKRANKVTSINVRMDESFKQKIEAIAERSNMASSEWIRRVCEERLEREENKKYGLAEQKQMYIDSKLIDAIKYALTLPEIQKYIREILWNKKEDY